MTSLRDTVTEVRDPRQLQMLRHAGRRPHLASTMLPTAVVQGGRAAWKGQSLSFSSSTLH